MQNCTTRTPTTIQNRRNSPQLVQTLAMKQNFFRRLFCKKNGPPVNASNKNHQVNLSILSNSSTSTTSSGTSRTPIKNKHAKRAKISFNILSRFKTKCLSYPEESQHNNTLTSWIRSPLHNACERGLSIALISELLSVGFRVTETDRYGWVPLHSAVYCICEGNISLRRGIRVIRILCEIDASMIHKFDKFSNTPLDLVHETIIFHQMSTRNKRSREALQMLYCELRQISINEYKQSKLKCEEGRRSFLYVNPSEHEEVDISSTAAVC